MNSIKLALSLSVLFLLFACGTEDNNPIIDDPEEFDYKFEFNNDTEGWIGDFADYPNHADIEEFYELDFAFSALPEPLDTKNGALIQTGNNHSDDLFMFAKKKITGLEPNQEYLVHMEVEIATNAASGQMGVGGAPGESVYIKAGAANIEPQKVLDNSDNHFRMNIDKGNQALGGSNMQIIGNFANGTDKYLYKLKFMETDTPIAVTANSEGEIWVIVGTDSGFEATTTIYYNSIFIDLEKN